ncbi:hypothetical protein PHMEG_0001820 [Phytophthora megakarya]|uniref:Uncharacterized protein n=1 Tax=Phytophthora megakarya TaxID=4795 RepID=A0A225X0V0_9STRA|nr:hypothetical protein PHMEG_0001820 [Phytophthora megakarya]
MFFEEANCYSGGNYYVYSTQQGDVNGFHVFEHSKAIRSMMVSVKLDAVNSKTLGATDIDRGCWTRPVLGHLQTLPPGLFENATFELNVTDAATSIHMG